MEFGVRLVGVAMRRGGVLVCGAGTDVELPGTTQLLCGGVQCSINCFVSQILPFSDIVIKFVDPMEIDGVPA